MDVPDKPADPNEVELTEVDTETPAPYREIFYHNLNEVQIKICTFIYIFLQYLLFL